MYATSADWKMNNISWSSEQEKEMTSKMKSLGALHWFLSILETAGRSKLLFGLIKKLIIWHSQST